MRPSLLLASAALLLCMPASARAQEKERTICDVKDAKNKCPGADCTCVDDTIEVTFDGKTESNLAVDKTKVGTKIAMTVMSDTKSDMVQGWSYGVSHDEGFLTINSATIEGTDAKANFKNGFDATSIDKIQQCTNPADPKCVAVKDGGGFISAVVLALTEKAQLPVQRNSLVKAEYTLTKEPGATGTVLMITDRLKKMGSPPVAINFTINGKSRVPTKVIDGFITGGGEPGEICDNKIDDDKDTKIDCADTDCATSPLCVKEICDNKIDDDKDTKIDCLDPDCAGDPKCPTDCPDYGLVFGPAVTKTTLDLKDAKSYVISMRNKEASLGFQLGVKATKAGTATNWEFSGTLGTDANRLIELIISDDKGNSQTPQTPNKATSNTGTVSKVERGAAISKFSTRDFFAFDTNPGVGGPGFTVGYVADTNPPQGGGNRIPATAATPACPVNEVLVVTLGAPPTPDFRRGDADGSGRLNVLDGILIIQIRVGNLPERQDCDDALDANDDGTLTVSDALTVLAWVFQRGPEPPDPFPNCGADPTNDSLGCAVTNCR